VIIFVKETFTKSFLIEKKIEEAEKMESFVFLFFGLLVHFKKLFFLPKSF